MLTTTQTPSRHTLTRQLDRAGIVYNRLTIHRDGLVSIRFSDPDINNKQSPGIDAAVVLRDRVLAALPGAQAVKHYDSRADWRNPANPPVLLATVVVEFPAQTQNARTTFAAQAL